MSFFPLLVIVHALAATVWTGGHLVLDRPRPFGWCKSGSPTALIRE
jgi:uncharacterized membrane protein